MANVHDALAAVEFEIVTTVERQVQRRSSEVVTGLYEIWQELVAFLDGQQLKYEPMPLARVEVASLSGFSFVSVLFADWHSDWMAVSGIVCRLELQAGLTGVGKIEPFCALFHGMNNHADLIYVASASRIEIDVLEGMIDQIVGALNRRRWKLDGHD